MPNVSNPEVQKVFSMADNGMELRAAFEACHEPTTWGNVQRQYKARCTAAAAAAAAAGSSSGVAASAPPSTGRVGTLAVWGAAAGVSECKSRVRKCMVQGDLRSVCKVYACDFGRYQHVRRGAHAAQSSPDTPVRVDHLVLTSPYLQWTTRAVFLARLREITST